VAVQVRRSIAAEESKFKINRQVAALSRANPRRQLGFLVFLSPQNLRAPSAYRRETLPHDRKLAEFYNANPTIWRGARQKWGTKTMQNFGRFYKPPTLIANISGMTHDIQNRKADVSILFMFYATDPVNYGALISTEI